MQKDQAGAAQVAGSGGGMTSRADDDPITLAEACKQRRAWGHGASMKCQNCSSGDPRGRIGLSLFASTTRYSGRAR